MRDKLEKGQPVETVQPERESTDWEPGALKTRKWNVSGEVIDHSDSHGLVYKVRHSDGTEGWYERRELRPRSPGTEYSPEERVVMLQKMQQLSDGFYSQATRIGCHAFIEFAGLMNEFIKVCADAHKKGQDFPFANTHTGAPLPFQHYHLAYLAEKLNCIYGPGLMASEANRRAFIGVLFDDLYRLVPVPQASQPTQFAEEDDTGS